jgi:hypothetical protein
MASVYSQFPVELRKLIDAEIEATTQHITLGMLSDLEYRRKAGYIAGLRKAEELFDDAMKNAETR